MKFFTDHYFQIGNTHYVAGKPCQDHALSSVYQNGACAIVSDGCSSGGANTDVGARILTFSTLKALSESVDNTARAQQKIIGETKHILGIHPEDLLATCVYARVTEEGGLVHIQGDGVIGFKYVDGGIRMVRYDWARNMPFYPSYVDDAKRRFIESHGADMDAACITAESIAQTADKSFQNREVTTHTLKEGIEGITVKISQDEIKRLEFIAAFTDGVTQIEHIDWCEAIQTFLAFKSTTGEFVKRRMIRGIKDMQQVGHGPLDDIAAAVIRLAHDEEKGDAL